MPGSLFHLVVFFSELVALLNFIYSVSYHSICIDLGSYGLSVLVWILCGLICVPGCLCYAELGTLIHSSGGDYTYIKMAFGDWAGSFARHVIRYLYKTMSIDLGFLRVWTEICCVRPAIIAVCGITAATYLLQPLFTSCSPPQLPVLLLACFFILVIVLLNVLSTPGSLAWQNISFYVKILALGFVISLGIFQLIRGRYEVLSQPFVGTETSIKKFSIALYIGLFPYSGWNYLSNAIEELKDPAKNFPIAIMSSIIASTILYSLAYSAYFTSMTPFEVMTADAVAVTFARNIYQPFGLIMPVLVSISALGGMNGRELIWIFNRFSFLKANIR